MALKREYTLTINKKTSVLNKNLTISTNDKGIDIIFRLIDCPYISLSLKKNLYARVILLDPLGKQIDSDITSIVENRVLFRLTKNLMSKITEAGIYKLYIAIMDDKNNVNLLPPVKCTIEESEVTVRGLSVGMTNQSSIDNSLSTDYGNEIALFNADGTYNRTVWISGDMITTARMNKLEDAASEARDSILSIKDEIKELDANRIHKVLIGTENENIVISNLPKGFYSISGYVRDFIGKDPYKLDGENYFMVTYMSDEYSKVQRCLAKEQKFIKYKYDKILETITINEKELVKCEQKDKYISLSLDENQYCELNVDSEIILPKVYDFTKINLFIKAIESSVLIFDRVTWINSPKLRLGELNLITLTYMNGTWYGEARTYVDDVPIEQPLQPKFYRRTLSVENNSIILGDTPIQDVSLVQNCVVDVPTNYLDTHVTLNVLAVNNLKLSFVQGSKSKIFSLEKDNITKFEIIMNGADFKVYNINNTIPSGSGATGVLDGIAGLKRRVELLESYHTGAGSPEEVIKYSIINNLANCTTENNIGTIKANDSYTTNIIANDGYILNSITVTMDGYNISSTVVNENNINIPNVIGNIVITARASEIAKIALYKISNITVYKGQTFNIFYSSNISAVKHEISWDGGNTFYDKTSEILIENTVNYKYSHNAETEYDSFSMAIRVTDADGNTDVKYFTITFEDYEVEPGEPTYTVTKNLTNCSSSNTSSSATEGASYTTSITADSGYTLGSITVTMNGNDITSTVVNGNNINIPNITGDLVITATAKPRIYLSRISNMTVDANTPFNILYSSNIPAVKHEFSWNGGNEFWDKTSEIAVFNSVNYKYAHEAKTDVSRYNMAIRVTDANGYTDTKTFSITFNQQVTPIQLNSISDISAVEGKSFGISYSTNVTPVKHEISWDGGSAYWDKTSEITTAGTNIYRYAHDAQTDVDSYNMAIRVTDANGHTSVQTFHIYFESSSTGKITQEAIVSDVTSSNAYTTYNPFFNNVNVDDGIIIPGLKSNMVPQGMCKNGNYIYVSAYDYTKADYSCFYVINASTKLLEKTIWLKDSYNHVGGITTNGTYLYITCGTRIGIISLSTVNSASNDAEITPTYITIKNDVNESVRCSTCVYDSTRNYLWVGQFNENSGDHAYAYIVNGASSLTYKAKIDVPQCTQGLFFGGDTVYYSCSYGRNKASLLYVCTWGGDNNDFWYSPQNVIEIPPTSEGIFKEGNLMYVLFENASNHYMNSDDVPTCPVDRIYAYNLAQSSVTDPFTFTQYYKLDSGVINSTTDNSFYTTREKNLVTAGNSYTMNINPANYVCICFYDSNDNYLGNNSNGFIEDNTSDWSVGSLSTTFTVPSGASYLRVCATGNGTQITGTLTNNGSSTPSNPGSDLLDSNGAYLVDDFSSNGVDRSKWDYEWGYVRNGELQNYQDTNAVVNNGILELQGRKNNGTWTSASIISKGHFAFMYGKIECRAKIDPTWGSFSAFWTLGDSFEFGYHNWASPETLGEWWAYCGEFDVMEFYSGNLTCGTFFNEREESGRVWYNNYDFSAWHTFAMEWLENGSLIFSIDGHELSRTNPTDNRAFHIPHFILINQAIGASGGTPADSTTAITQYVDWVKYYPASTSNLVLNSSDFSLQVTDPNDSAHNCMVRPIFNDNCINKSLTWSSSDSSLVWVHSGLCGTYAGANGTATITATSHSGVSKSITLTVTNGTIR